MGFPPGCQTKSSMSSEIVMSTLNARYIHSAFALRYLYANLGALKNHSCIREFTINQQAIEIACLLYTSPSPRDLSTSRMPSSA